MDSDEIDRFKAGGSRWGEFDDPVPEKKKIGKVLLEMPPAAPVDHVELEQLNLREKPSSDPAEMEQILEGTQREQIPPPLITPSSSSRMGAAAGSPAPR